MADKKHLRQRFRKAVEQHGREWSEIQPAWLGNYGGAVESGTPGIYLARLLNGKVVNVHNTMNVPPTFDLHIFIGKNKNLPKLWQIIRVVEDYDVPAAGGQIAYHHEQHMFGAGDMLPVDRKQVMAFTVLVNDGANFIVSVYGGVAVTASGVKLLAHQTVDLSAEVPDAGAVYVNIEVDDDLVISLNTGAIFGSPLAGTVDDIPTPDPGKYVIAYVVLFEGQAELLDEHIRVPMPIGQIARSVGAQIDQADADTPQDADLFGFWDVGDSALKSTTWANLKSGFQYRRHVVVALSGGGWSFVDSGAPSPVETLAELE